MYTIWRFPFEIKDVVTISMPRGARIISVQIQNNTPVVWAIVDIEEKNEPRVLSIVGTGFEADHVLYKTHIGTVQLNDFVWHIFE